MITNLIISDKSFNNTNYKLQSACDDIFLSSKLNTFSINIAKRIVCRLKMKQYLI